MKNNPTSSAQRNNPPDENDETASTARPPIIHQPLRSQLRPHQRTFRDFDPCWMPLPKGIRNCPPGLEYLATVDQLIVRQEIEFLELVTNIETENRYMVKNIMGQKMYYAQERSNFCARQCCNRSRPFDMQILDQFGNQAINFYRPLASDSCYCPCCLQRLEVFCAPNYFLGMIQQEWSVCIPIFAVKNAAGITVLRIEGPLCIISCFNDIDFKILTGDGRQQVGVITRQWPGLVREWFTDADYFGITFPMDLDVTMKAVMLGACFLIDFMFFEKGPKQSTSS